MCALVKYWLRVLSEIKTRGTADVCIVVCDGLKGLPASIETVWPQAITQTCIVHLLRNSFRYASKRNWAAIASRASPHPDGHAGWCLLGASVRTG